MWALLKRIERQLEVPRLMAGDFNKVSNQRDRVGGECMSCVCARMSIATKEGMHLFIFDHVSTKNNRRNKNYNHVRGPPSDYYKHWSEPKVRRRYRPSLTGAGQTLL